MARCPNCSAVFFKTLGTRIVSATANVGITLVYKKRCKRCKLKYFFIRHLPENRTELTHYETWCQAREICELGVTAPGPMRVTAGEYTRRVARGSDQTGGYLRVVKGAERGLGGCR
ncbi:MAG: hypothetical protein AB7P76_10550 [Candidatus Melainabacteria bacterium]